MRYKYNDWNIFYGSVYAREYINLHRLNIIIIEKDKFDHPISMAIIDLRPHTLNICHCGRPSYNMYANLGRMSRIRLIPALDILYHSIDNVSDIVTVYRFIWFELSCLISLRGQSLSSLVMHGRCFSLFYYTFLPYYTICRIINVQMHLFINSAI